MNFLRGRKNRAPPGTFVIKNKNANRLYATIRNNVHGYTQSNEQHLGKLVITSKSFFAHAFVACPDDAAILEAVLLPTHEDNKEWIAANTVDFFNELTVLYGFCWKNARAKNYKPGEGFPLNHQYQWATEKGKHKSVWLASQFSRRSKEEVFK